MYRSVSQFLGRFIKRPTLFKVLFNLSPMYRRSTGRIKFVSDDIHEVEIEIPLNYKNRNFVGTIFGGSLSSATDPIYMIQLMHILGDEYVVWDKATTIRFKRPANENAFARFVFLPEEIELIKADVERQKEITLIKTLNITNKHKVVFAEVDKTIYISSKGFYKEKRNQRKTSSL